MIECYHEDQVNSARTCVWDYQRKFHHKAIIYRDQERSKVTEAPVQLNSLMKKMKDAGFNQNALTVKRLDCVYLGLLL